MLERTKQRLLTFAYPPLELEEVVIALDASPAPEHMRTVELAQRLHDTMKGERFPRGAHDRQQAVRDALNAKVLLLLWGEPKAPVVEQLHPAMQVLQSDAVRRGEPFELKWHREHAGNALTVVIGKGSFRALSVRAVFSLTAGAHREHAVKGAVHYKMLVDRTENWATLDDLHGNGRFENPDFEGLGLGRLLTSLGNEALKAMLPAHARVSGRAFHAAEDEAHRFERISREELSQMRARRVRFWRDVGLSFDHDAAQQYIGLATEDTRFRGTVETLAAISGFNRNLERLFGEPPTLADFQGPLPSAGNELSPDVPM